MTNKSERATFERPSPEILYEMACHLRVVDWSYKGQKCADMLDQYAQLIAEQEKAEAACDPEGERHCANCYSGQGECLMVTKDADRVAAQGGGVSDDEVMRAAIGYYRNDTLPSIWKPDRYHLERMRCALEALRATPDDGEQNGKQ